MPFWRIGITILLLIFATNASAQHQRDNDPYDVTAEKLRAALELSEGARIARAFQYQLGFAEQFGTISGASGTFLKAPEHYLIQHSLKFQFSELFLSQSDFAKILKTYHDEVEASRNPAPTSASQALSLVHLCGKTSPLQCLTDSGSWWKRALAGFTGTFSLSERQRVVGGIIVPEGTFPANYDKTGQITFDPSQIFINGSNWSAALSVLSGMSTKGKSFYKNEKQTLYDQCFRYNGTEVRPLSTEARASLSDRVPECVAAFGGSKGGRVGFLAVALPTFTFKRASQFDFVKNAGILIPAPFGESAVNSYTFTWDLKRLIAPASARAAVVDAMLLQPKTTTDAAKQASDVPAAESNGQPKNLKLCVTLSHGQPSYLSVQSSFTATACRDFAASLDVAGQYRLGCVLGNGVSLSAPMDLDVAVAMPAGNSCGW
jgi:hypothetical protein